MGKGIVCGGGRARISLFAALLFGLTALGCWAAPSAFASQDSVLGDAAIVSDRASAAISDYATASASGTGSNAESSTLDSSSDAPQGYAPRLSRADGAIASLAATDSTRSGDWSYYEETDSDGNTVYTLNGYYGSDSAITLPATLDGKTITNVAFYGGNLPESVTSITFPATVKEIGPSSFAYSMVSEVSFPANSQLETIGERAFCNTPITSFTMPASLKTLGQGAFASSLITKLVFNEQLEPMYRVENVLSGDILYKVEKHYNPCFAAPSGIEFVVPATSKNYQLVNGALLSKDGTILYAQQSDLGGGAYRVPDTVKILGEYSLYRNGTFTEIELPNGLEVMEECCLYGTSIRSLRIPDSVKHVQGEIGRACYSLETLVIGNGLEELGESAGWNGFYDCKNLKSLTLGSNIRVIGNAWFANTAITQVYLPPSVQELYYGAFGDNANLVSVTGGEGLQRIEQWAFRKTGLTNFHFGENYRFISNRAFDGCGFTPAYPSYLEEFPDGYYRFDGNLAVKGDQDYTMAYQVLDLVNQERAKQGLSALTMDADLLSAAMQRAAEIAVIFEHTRPTGQGCYTASSKMTRENIAAGNNTAESVVSSWMNSSGHKANILSSDSKSIGIGCMKVSGRYWWVQCFGSEEATAVTVRPSDTTDQVVSVPFMMDEISALGGGFKVYPVDATGTRVVSAGDSLGIGESQRYALFALPVSGYGWLSKIDDSCISWTVNASGVVALDAATGTVTGKSAGSFAVNASVGDGGALSASAESKVAAPEPEPTPTPSPTPDPTPTPEPDPAPNPDPDPTPSPEPDPTPEPGAFPDVDENAWYSECVTLAAQLGYMKGYPDGTFGPDLGLNRAEAACTLLNMAKGSDENTDSGFPDVASSDWFAGSVTWARSAGVMGGYQDGTFGPYDPLTREQVACTLYNYAKSIDGADVSVSDGSILALSLYADADDIDDWAVEAVAWAVEHGVMGNGDLLNPRGPITRAEMAAMTTNYQPIARS